MEGEKQIQEIFTILLLTRHRIRKAKKTKDKFQVAGLGNGSR